MGAQIVAPVISIVSTGLAAGVYLGHRMSISMARHKLSPSSFVQLGQCLHVYFARVMPLFMIGSVGGSLFWSFMLRSSWRTVHFWLVVGASIGMIFVIVISQRVNIPINKQLMNWSVDAPPANLNELWEPWERAHSIRIVLALSSFVFEVVALAIAQTD